MNGTTGDARGHLVDFRASRRRPVDAYPGAIADPQERQGGCMMGASRPHDSGWVMVLTADDELRDSLVTALREFDHCAVGPRSGADAVRWLRVLTRPAQVLLDADLADLSAFRFGLERLGYASLPILLMVGIGLPVPKDTGLQVVGILRLPSGLDQLLQAMVRHRRTQFAA